MLNHDHPDDERLAALAAGDIDPLADASLSAHVTSCDRCAGVVRELGVLRTALADLPDIKPHRPLRLIPPVEAERAGGIDRLGLWARRLFAPALTMGAVLAMVGVVGTAAPGLGGFAATGAGGADSDPSTVLEMYRASAAAAEESEGEAAMPDAQGGEGGGTAGGFDNSAQASDGAAAGEEREDSLASPVQAERSPWPMVLFAGIAVMIGAALLRWILAPRPG